MRRIELAPLARDDLDAIFLDGLDRFGFAQADKLRSAIFRAFSRLAESPFMGEDMSGIVDGARIFRRPPPCRIVYRFNDATLFVLRVFHGQQDYERLLG